MKQQAQWLLCVVCALGVSGVVLGQGGGPSGGSKPESELRRRKPGKESTKREEAEEAEEGEGTRLLSKRDDQERERNVLRDDDEDDDEDEEKSVPAARRRRPLLARRRRPLLGSAVRMGERIFNALRTGYGSRVVAAGICERASQSEDKEVRNWMYKLAAEKYLDEAKACRAAGKSELEEMAQKHFIDAVERIGDREERDQLYKSTAEKYLDEAKACGAAGNSEREEMALEHFIDAVGRIGDRELQVQLYAIAAEGYLTEATRCEDAGNVEREMEALENYAYFLTLQALRMPYIPDIPANCKQKLELYRKAAVVLDELAEQGYKCNCNCLRASVCYKVGFMGVQLARATDKDEDAKEASEVLLEEAKKNLKLAKELFIAIKETEMAKKANELLEEANWLCSPNKRLKDGRSLCDQARQATNLEEQLRLLQQARKIFREGVLLCKDEDTEVKIQLLKAIGQTYDKQDRSVPSSKCRGKVAKFYEKIAAEEQKRGNTLAYAEALTEQARALWLQIGCTDDDEKTLLLKAAKLSIQALESLRGCLETLSRDTHRNSVITILHGVTASLDCYGGKPLLAQTERFDLAVLIMEVLSKDKVRQCITQRDLGRLYGDLAAYFKTVAPCKKIDDQVRQEAKKRVADCHAQITQIENELRRIEEGLEESEEEEDEEIVVEEDTNSSKKEADVPPSPGATHLVDLGSPESLVE